uniref:Uncharacterized protein MANES_01G043200 n=1 Tax=Rhizophora mucronata TaxID=61149 RepID=A0A2P2LCE5_RHIMU
MGEAAVNGIQEELEERIEEVREEKTESETAGENADNNENKEKKRKKMEGGAASGLLRLFPKMALRVLLVESDDSTRQIIAALLRKCSYRVAAVPNGLKAWEILKRRPHNVDLILAEVDLPSISGYALLTLIMEHETCKNVPVIMMSSEDSISTVYKCMLRGAADYLVKPIRRNELRNLWQHVWRRQSSLVAGNCPQDESVGQDNIEATSGNNGINNHSRGDIACSQRSKRYIEKENDDQVSASFVSEGANYLLVAFFQASAMASTDAHYSTTYLFELIFLLCMLDFNLGVNHISNSLGLMLLECNYDGIEIGHFLCFHDDHYCEVVGKTELWKL